MIMKMPFKKNFKGQTAIELAVFGAILMFLIGVIVRTGFSSGLQQQSTLTGTRLAMKFSYDYSQEIKGESFVCCRGTNGNASRNSASVLLIDDRLAPGSGRYGAIDRTQFIAQGSATHSRNLFQPIGVGELFQLPNIDVLVNGVHFPFLAANQVIYCLDDPANIVADRDGGDPSASVCNFDVPPFDKVTDASWNPECMRTRTVTYSQCPTEPTFNAPDGLCPGTGVNQCGNHVANGTTCTGTETDPGFCCDLDAPEAQDTFAPWESVGCRELVARRNNLPDEDDWCIANCTGPDQEGCCAIDASHVPDNPERMNYDVDTRFDLDRDGSSDVPDSAPTGQIDRTGFAWQWYRVWGVDDRLRARSSTVSTNFVVGSRIARSSTSATRREVPVYRRFPISGVEIEYFGEGVSTNRSNDVTRNVSLDIDGDFEEENFSRVLARDSNGVVLRAVAIDFQDGDYSSTDDPSGNPPKPAPGFTNDFAMYSRQLDGTFMVIEEGQLFEGDLGSDDLQYIRTARGKDQVDVVQRIFQLSNHTGRFCNGEVGSPTTFNNNVHPRTEEPCGTIGTDDQCLPPNNEPNPVEVCCDTDKCMDETGILPAGNDTCFGDNSYRTCLFVGDLSSSYPELNNQASRYPVLYIRSRIESKQGRKWITETTDDPAIDFEGPPLN